MVNEFIAFIGEFICLLNAEDNVLPFYHAVLGLFIISMAFPILLEKMCGKITMRTFVRGVIFALFMMFAMAWALCFYFDPWYIYLMPSLVFIIVITMIIIKKRGFYLWKNVKKLLKSKKQ